jgi:hypothetical protein
MRPEVPLGPASGDQVRAACSGATFFGGGSNVPASPTLYVFGKLNGSLNLNAGGSLYDADASTPGVNYNGGGKRPGRC